MSAHRNDLKRPQDLCVGDDAAPGTGAKIVRAARMPAPNDYLSVVLAMRPENGMDEHITWIFNHYSGGYAHGHYAMDFVNGVEDFEQRIKKFMEN